MHFWQEQKRLPFSVFSKQTSSTSRDVLTSYYAPHYCSFRGNL